MTKDNKVEPNDVSSPITKRIAKVAAMILLVSFATYGMHEFLVRYTTRSGSGITAMYDALTAVFITLLLYVLFDK